MTNKFTITRRDILESFNVGDLDNPVTLMNIQEALINCDREN